MPLSVRELSPATADYNTVKTLIQGIKYGKQLPSENRFGIDQEEFTLQQGCLLRGVRVYVPTLRMRVLQELQSTHFGVTRTKSLARGYCWWPGIDNAIETMIKNCAECQATRPEPSKVPLHCWETPTTSFQRVHVDYAGPFMDTYFFILVDAFSKWPEIRITKSITAEHTVQMCREIFSNHGIPPVLVSDHGRQFTSEVFERFLKLIGIYYIF